MKTITVYASEVVLYAHEVEVADNATYDDAVEAFYALPEIQAGAFESTDSESFQIDRIEGLA
jgi:hypothetical protein